MVMTWSARTVLVRLASPRTAKDKTLVSILLGLLERMLD